MPLMKDVPASHRHYVSAQFPPEAGLLTLFAILQEKLNQLEADLQQWRNQMALGWIDSSGQLQKASSVQLRNTMRTDTAEDVRKACWEVEPDRPDWQHMPSLVQ